MYPAETNTASAPLLPEPADTRPATHAASRGSRLDAWWQRIIVGRERWWYWGGPIGVTILAAILRFQNLGLPKALMFDETYYVKDAVTLWLNGHEMEWPKNPDKAFVAGKVTSFLSSPEFVAHPPLGKWIIGAGMYLTGGPTSAFAWRFSTALLGTLAVLIVALIARHMFKSAFAGTVAGFLMAINGVAIVLSRTALLDGIVAFFVIAAFGTLLLDRSWHHKRLARLAKIDRARRQSSIGGPVVWWRPWLLATGVLAGAACGVKWSGMYAVAVFGIYVIVDDMIARWRLGYKDGWPSGGILKQGPISFVTFVPAALVVYLLSWTGWLVTQGGWGRLAAPETGAFDWIPRSLRSLWLFHEQMYGFSIGLSTPHAWESNALQWIPMIRPTLFYRTQGETGCGAKSCIATVSSIDNPLLWWSAWIAIALLIWWLVKTRDWRIGMILVGMGATYAPWLLYLHRTTFFSYSVIYVPFLMLAVTYVIVRVWGRRNDFTGRRTAGQISVGVYLGTIAVTSLWFYPLWIGANVPYWFWAMHAWLPATWQ